MRDAAGVPARRDGGGKNLLRVHVALFALALMCLRPPPAAGAEGPRSLALVDFAVRSAPGQAGEAAWLGAALS